MTLSEYIRNFFLIIQGGMGIGVSNWILARAVSLLGELGIVSGTAIHLVFARRLQLGDPGGHMKRAVDAFPFKEVAERVCAKYYIPGGKAVGKKFANIEMFSLSPSRELIELTILANFAEVYLAKEGHDGFVGINYLEKVQLPHLYSLYGAMLAGVDFVTVGAGIPIQFSDVMERLAIGETAKYRLEVVDATPGEFSMQFNPSDFFGAKRLIKLNVPAFFPIISATILAKRMAAELKEKITAFIVEESTAGGHNARPRGKKLFNGRGEPLYGHKDKVDLKVLAGLGIPFFLAGSYANSEKFEVALKNEASGIQVGSIFALCNNSGLDSNLRSAAIELATTEQLDVFTSSDVSPTGFEFKVARIPGTLSDEAVYAKRVRICDIGLLRKLVKIGDGKVAYRCSAEPVEAYVLKGGVKEDTLAKGCLCNSLSSDVGLPQIRANGYVEPPLLTLGDDLSFIKKLVKDKVCGYSVKEAVEYIRKKR